MRSISKREEKPKTKKQIQRHSTIALRKLNNGCKSIKQNRYAKATTNIRAKQTSKTKAKTIAKAEAPIKAKANGIAKGKSISIAKVKPIAKAKATTQVTRNISEQYL